MKTILKLGFLLLFLIIAVPVFVLAYFGFIPGLSDLLGTNKPKDLGVRYTEADRTSGRTKSQVIWETLPQNTPAAQSIQRFGKREVKADFTSGEISALMNNRPWRYWPYENVQVKFNADGTAEISGALNKSKVSGYSAAIALPQQAIDFALKFLPSNPIFYVKGKAALSENNVSVFEPQAFEIGRVSLPVEMFLSLNLPTLTSPVYAQDVSMLNELSSLHNKKALIISYINSRLSSVNGFYGKNAYFTQDKLHFDGTLPEKEATVR